MPSIYHDNINPLSQCFITYGCTKNTCTANHQYIHKIDLFKNRIKAILSNSFQKKERKPKSSLIYDNIFKLDKIILSHYQHVHSVLLYCKPYQKAKMPQFQQRISHWSQFLKMYVYRFYLFDLLLKMHS